MGVNEDDDDEADDEGEDGILRFRIPLTSTLSRQQCTASGSARSWADGDEDGRADVPSSSSAATLLGLNEVAITASTSSSSPITGPLDHAGAAGAGVLASGLTLACSDV